MRLFPFMILVGSLFLAGSLEAGTKKCSSADQNLTYSYVGTDGGAARDPEGSVKIGNKVYKVDSGGQRPDANAIFSPVQVMLQEPVIDGDTKSWTYMTVLRVATLEEAKDLFTGIVLCAETKYVGKELPKTPPPKKE